MMMFAVRGFPERLVEIMDTGGDDLYDIEMGKISTKPMGTIDIQDERTI